MPDPTVVVEVLSPTTETHDRIRKWREYQRIATLQHFVLVAQSERRVEVYSRTEAGWEIKAVESPEDAVVLKAIGADFRWRRSISAAVAEVRGGLIARCALPTRRGV